LSSFWFILKQQWTIEEIAAKLKIEKRADEILIVHYWFSISQNELKF
jgi:hypothetical protein